MSDEEDASTGSDFSVSEDEWLPTKGPRKRGASHSMDQVSSSDDGDSAADSDLEDFVGFVESPVKKQSKPTTARKRPASKGASPKQQGKAAGTKKKRLSPGLRDRLYQQYKKDLLKERVPARAPTNSSVTEILQNCQYQRKPSLEDQTNRRTVDDSDSSGDDHLVDPEKLDLGATFFDRKEPKPSSSAGTTEQRRPNIGTGKHLSDDSSDSDEPRKTTGEESLPASIPKRAAEKLISHINQQSFEYMNFTNLDQFTAKVEEAKRLLQSYRQTEETEDNVAADVKAPATASNVRNESVKNLLALGETGAAAVVIATDRKEDTGEAHDSSDSEWEEVKTGENVEEKQEGNRKPDTDSANRLITIELESAQSKRKRWEELELELYIKRQINKMKRKNQLNYHKTSILCAIAIGQRLNRAINAAHIQGHLLSMMQNNHGSSADKWNEEKVQLLAGWFKAEFTLRSNDFLDAQTGCNLQHALSLALHTSTVACRRDYILLFLSCLRLGGAHARLVHSANVPTKRPAMSELCPISERQIKENFEKRMSNGKTPQKKDDRSAPTQPSEEQYSITASGPVGDKTAMDVSPVGDIVKENANDDLPTARSTSGRNKLKATTKNERIRLALSPLNIPQLDGGDDESEASFKPTRILRSRAGAGHAVESPKSSPFAKRKSNERNVTGKSQMADASRKRKLFSSIPEVERVPATLTRKTRQTNSSEQRTKKVSTTTEKKPEPPSDDDNAFDTAGSSKKGRTSQSLRTTRAKATCGTMATKELDKSQVPCVLLTDIKDNIVSRSCSENEPEGNRQKKVTITSRPQRSKQLKGNSVLSDDSSDDSDFEVRKGASNAKKKRTKSSATGSISTSKKSPRQRVRGKLTCSGKTDLWIEFYCQKAERWITFDLFSERTDCVEYIVRNATSPISYVLAWDNDARLKDVTARYVQNWNTACRKLRVEQPWLDKVFAPFAAERTERELREEKELNKLDVDKPLPKTIAELKNHPLYALRRHLLKFEAIYPSEPPPAGYIRGETIYPRECVHTLHTREKWYKQGRVVRPFEEAYKVVKSWKYDRLKNEWLKNQPCDIFGLWQTDEYDPPTAENGLVPRNEYGNVELFTDKMLPKGTVHLKLPGLNKVCKRLGIDCAPALTGFDMAKMRVVPVYDGFVVCQEFEQQLVDAWFVEMEEEERRETEKREKRIYGNWKRLIKGLLVRRKLQNKYNFDNLQ